MVPPYSVRILLVSNLPCPRYILFAILCSTDDHHGLVSNGSTPLHTCRTNNPHLSMVSSTHRSASLLAASFPTLSNVAAVVTTLGFNINITGPFNTQTTVATLQIIVATVNVDCRLDLKTTARHARNAEYHPRLVMNILYHKLFLPNVSQLRLCSVNPRQPHSSSCWARLS